MIFSLMLALISISAFAQKKTKVVAADTIIICLDDQQAMAFQIVSPWKNPACMPSQIQKDVKYCKDSAKGAFKVDDLSGKTLEETKALGYVLVYASAYIKNHLNDKNKVSLQNIHYDYGN